ncbi:decarboxylating 6-phosphogluconate dehydrogenase [Candidatus Daviesbacteria bacterium]|nr:decarboxylating 6-phosphogluconate dehydrogenase [Candidatus Daviesbacteria bacterium]
MRIGYIGLGRMGRNMVLRLLEQGVEVVVWNRSPNPVKEVVQKGAIGAENLEDLVSLLRRAHDEVVIWIMLPAGDVTDQYIDKLLPFLSAGDLIIDGGNSFYQDTLKRAEKLSEKSIHFIDIGVSGGPRGAKEGACLMIGGSKENFKRIEPIAKAAAAPNAYAHLGKVGAGHFAKMVHNAIENGMMESIGEGLSILKSSPFKYDFSSLLDLYNHGSVIESRLIGWAKAAFDEDAELSDTSSIIGSGGAGKERVKAEGDWAIELAKKIGIDAPAIEHSMRVRSESAQVAENSPNGFRNKVISALRGQFGQHDVKILPRR